jgi:diaminopimelate decarboxylase
MLAAVTQLKRKGAINYVGVDAGMNALIRPALYNAYHEVVNLSRCGGVARPATLEPHPPWRAAVCKVPSYVRFMSGERCVGVST